MNLEELIKAFHKAGEWPDKGLVSAFEVIGLVEAAEEEIARSQRLFPGDADKLWHSFALLKPSYTSALSEMLYRAHCRELLWRVVHDQDTRPATKAEVIGALSEFSLSNAWPPGAVPAYLYTKLFRETFPGQQDALGLVEAMESAETLVSKDSLTDFADELEAKLVKRLAVEDRHV